MSNFDVSDLPTRAWLHHCGSLNAGDYDDTDARLGERAVCGGCLFEVKYDSEITRFNLIPTTAVHTTTN
jgi:hypothetical protein